jgi:hypothetical protein
MQALLDSLSVIGPASLLGLMAIYAAAAVFSGLSGFGFSAIGCLSLVILPPQLGVALLMGLSLFTQMASFKSLWGELRHHVGPWHSGDGVLPYLAGGAAGMPIGLRILATFGTSHLTVALGLLLIGYAAWSLLKPVSLLLKKQTPSRARSFLVGTAGGVVGGFSAFPGSALVVWNGLVGVGKEKGRALTQPYILWTQIVGLAILLATHHTLFGPQFFGLFLAALPAALLGNRLGIAIYRRTGDIGYRRVTFAALGVSGVGLLIKVALV